MLGLLLAIRLESRNTIIFTVVGIESLVFVSLYASLLLHYTVSVRLVRAVYAVVIHSVGKRCHPEGSVSQLAPSLFFLLLLGLGPLRSRLISHARA